MIMRTEDLSYQCFKKGSFTQENCTEERIIVCYMVTVRAQDSYLYPLFNSGFKAEVCKICPEFEFKTFIK